MDTKHQLRQILEISLIVFTFGQTNQLFAFVLHKLKGQLFYSHKFIFVIYFSGSFIIPHQGPLAHHDDLKLKENFCKLSQGL